jgi:hypothetical protein
VQVDKTPDGFSDAHWKFVLDTLNRIVDEAIKTKPLGMSQRFAVDILITDRLDRGILNRVEAKALREFLWANESETV